MNNVRTDDGWLQVDKYGSWNSLTRSGLAEKRSTRVGRHCSCLACTVDCHSVRLDSMLETVQFPARVADLNARLSDMDADTLALYTSQSVSSSSSSSPSAEFLIDYLFSYPLNPMPCWSLIHCSCVALAVARVLCVSWLIISDDGFVSFSCHFISHKNTHE